MIKSVLILLFSLSLSLSSIAQQKYTVDLLNVKKDRIKIELEIDTLLKEQVRFNFPKTVPGTYSTLDYGKYIHKFKAYNKNREALKVKRSGENSFIIYKANTLSNIRYEVEDSWDSGVKKNKIFEPAGTGFEKEKYFYINNGALFGYFDKEYSHSYDIKFIKSSLTEGTSSLHSIEKSTLSERYFASDYHELIDNPVLFTNEKREELSLAGIDIIIASYYKNSDSSAYYIRKEIEPSMQAIASFVGVPPVNRYVFVNYVDDQRKIGALLSKGRLGVFDIIRVLIKLGGQGYGALEHGNSSSYYLADFGKNTYANMVTETAIHEFMHIYTPLNLHSTRIGNFDYDNPLMSKHLWLYEGVTEYFSVLIQLQGKLDSIDRILNNQIKAKIVQAAKYPDSIPFTKMSEQVLSKPYTDLYNHVYDRGAIMGMLLDFEIMYLTKGTKTLKSVVFELAEEFGKDRSFDEDALIPLFVSKVHPGLQAFFDNYINGKKPLPIREGFEKAGISYQAKTEGMYPVNILSKRDNDIKVIAGFIENDYLTIVKTGKKEYCGFRPGDKVKAEDIRNCYRDKNGDYVKEGSLISLKVLRQGKEETILFPAKFKKETRTHQIERLDKLTPEQQKLFTLWTTGN